jgi:hypothetical protein
MAMRVGLIRGDAWVAEALVLVIGRIPFAASAMAAAGALRAG